MMMNCTKFDTNTDLVEDDLNSSSH